MSRSRRFPLASRVAAVVAAVALGLGLSGCGSTSGKPGAAAIVGGTELSEAKVSQAIDDWYDLTQQNVSRAEMVVVLAQALAFDQAGEQMGLDTSDEAINPKIDDMLAGKFDKTSADLGAGGRAVLRPSALFAQAQQNGQDTELLAAVKQIPTKLNPKYGYELDAEGNAAPLPPLGDLLVAQNGQ